MLHKRLKKEQRCRRQVAPKADVLLMSLDNKPALRLRRNLPANLLGLHVFVGVHPLGADDLRALRDVLREDGFDSLEGLPILPTRSLC